MSSGLADLDPYYDLDLRAVALDDTRISGPRRTGFASAWSWGGRAKTVPPILPSMSRNSRANGPDQGNHAPAAL